MLAQTGQALKKEFTLWIPSAVPKPASDDCELTETGESDVVSSLLKKEYLFLTTFVLVDANA